MTIPLLFLAVMSIAAGYVGLPNAIFGAGANVFEGFVDGAFEPALAVKGVPEQSFSEVLLLLVVSGIVASTGVFVAWLMYHRRRATAPLLAGKLSGPLYPISKGKWFWEEIYNVLLVRAGLLTMNGLRLFDRYVIDGAVNGVAWLTAQSAQKLRKVQTGFIGNYVLYMAVGLVVIVGLFYFTNGIRF
jgi:NADH-quinone oxidoreductase subunit L